ncbi:hypothetical protein ACA910_002657 [Epithemia clementina (nom. ined.)]
MASSSSLKPLAVIMGVGDGVSASLARLLYQEGYKLTLAARNVDKIQELAQQTEATCVACDATNVTQVQSLFANLPTSSSSPLKVAIYNPSYRVKGPITQVDPEQVRKSIDVTAYGSFLFAQQAAQVMMTNNPDDASKGTILFTGASAGMKGFPQSAAFAMGKFAQRGLAQSMARELHPQGIHVAWISIDGVIGAGQAPWSDQPDSMMHPDEIAKTFLAVIQQHRSTWTNEMEIRPWVEKF